MNDDSWIKTFINESLDTRQENVKFDILLGGSSITSDVTIDGVNYVVGFYKRYLEDTENFYEVVFNNKNKNNSIEITGDASNSLRVFSVVGSIIEKFIEEYKPNFFYFSAKEPSRVRLYDRLSEVVASKTSYSIIQAQEIKEQLCDDGFLSPDDTLYLFEKSVISESFENYFNYEKIRSIPYYKNPNKQDWAEILKFAKKFSNSYTNEQIKSVRMIVTDSGDIYAWPGMIIHRVFFEQVRSVRKGDVGLTLSYDNGHDDVKYEGKIIKDYCLSHDFCLGKEGVNMSRTVLNSVFKKLKSLTDAEYFVGYYDTFPENYFDILEKYFKTVVELI